jgi:hypothetical protein
MIDDRLFRDLPDSFDSPPGSLERPAAPKSPPFGWGLAAGMSLWLGGTLFSLWHFVPKFAAVYSQYGLSLPDLSVVILTASQVSMRWSALFVVAALGVSIWAGKWKGRVRTVSRGVLPIAILTTIGALAVGLFLPLILIHPDQLHSNLEKRRSELRVRLDH